MTGNILTPSSEAYEGGVGLVGKTTRKSKQGATSGQCYCCISSSSRVSFHYFPVALPYRYASYKVPLLMSNFDLTSSPSSLGIFHLILLIFAFLLSFVSSSTLVLPVSNSYYSNNHPSLKLKQRKFSKLCQK